MGFAVLELWKIKMYETYYDKLQAYFGQQKFQVDYMDTYSFGMSKKTEKKEKV